MMMISHHRMGDNGNGPDRVIENILATSTTDSTHGFPGALFQNLMRILVAPEDNKSLDRVSEHLYMYQWRRKDS